MGVVTVETKSNHTVIMHRRKYTKATIQRCCSKTNIPPNFTSATRCLVLGVRGLHLTPWLWCPPCRSRRVRPQGWENNTVKMRTSSQARCCLSPSGSAVLCPCGALKLLKLTYYLLDWANMFVFVCMCVQVVAVLYFPFLFIWIECGKGCRRHYQRQVTLHLWQKM